MGKMGGGALHRLLSGDTDRPHNGVQHWPTWQMTGIPSSYPMCGMGLPAVLQWASWGPLHSPLPSLL